MTDFVALALQNRSARWRNPHAESSDPVDARAAAAPYSCATCLPRPFLLRFSHSATHRRRTRRGLPHRQHRRRRCRQRRHRQRRHWRLTSSGALGSPLGPRCVAFTRARAPDDARGQGAFQAQAHPRWCHLGKLGARERVDHHARALVGARSVPCGRRRAGPSGRERCGRGECCRRYQHPFSPYVATPFLPYVRNQILFYRWCVGCSRVS